MKEPSKTNRRNPTINLILLLAILCIFALNASTYAATKKITLSKTSTSLCWNVPGRNSFVLKAKLYGGLTGEVRFSSSDEAIARVDDSGKLTGLKKGKAVITVSCGGAKAECAVTVYESGIKLLSSKSATIKEDWVYQIRIETAPKTTTVTYSSSDNSVATVSDTGLVTAQKPGAVVITIRSNGKSKTVRFTVKPAEVRKLKWNSSWEFASFSKIHTGRPKMYRASNPNGKVVAVNAGHGTRGGESVQTLCHPDGTAKVTNGSTAIGSIYAVADSYGTRFLDGTTEAAANLSLALIFRDKLLAAGYDVLIIREDYNSGLDVIARTVFANQYADCHLSLHYDSSTNNKGFYYLGVPDIASYRAMYPVKTHYQKSNRMGECLLAAMRKKGIKIFSRGNMPTDLMQTSYSKIASLDVEVGDRASLHTPAAQTPIAEALVDGLNKFFGF